MKNVIDWLFGDGYAFASSWTCTVLHLDSGLELLVLLGEVVFICVLIFSKKIRSKFF